jgi:hypothetical protein
LTTSPAPPQKTSFGHAPASSPAAEATDLGRANPFPAGDADNHPYAYSSFPDKATKATPADKMDGCGAGLDMFV